jgi:ATP-binding cassette subfamily F protein 3
MNSLACPILLLEDGAAAQYPSYEAMMHRRDVAPEAIPAEKQPTASRPAYGKEQRRRRAELRAGIKALEDEMEQLSLRILDLETAVNDPDILRDHVRLREVCDELDDARARQDDVLAQWEKLVEEQESYLEGDDEAASGE